MIARAIEIMRGVNMPGSGNQNRRTMSAKDWGQIIAVIVAVASGYAKLESDVEHMRGDIGRIERNLEALTREITTRGRN